MSEREPEKIATATEVGRHVPQLREAARALLREDLTPIAYVALLEQHGLFADALRFTAHWLPKPRAIWWGALCAWHQCRPLPAPAAENALAAVICWLRDPSEDNRRQSETAGRAAGLATPAGALALAVFWSDGSITPRGLPHVRPGPDLSARTVAAAVLAASLAEPAHTERVQRQFLALARAVADGKNLWKRTPS